MPTLRSARVRASLWTLHRWIAVALMVLLVPIAASGCLLAWQDPIDALLHPGRYAVSATEAARPPSAYLASARAALEPGFVPNAVRYPSAVGRPVTVTARQAGDARRLMTVYLDPPTARVLDVVDYRASWIGILHRFHENLTIPDYSGRQIVGVGGVGMLILALSGLWLWWPRQGRATRGLRWQRTSSGFANIHHTVGVWIAIPLAAVSLTGIYLAYPQTARSLMAGVASMAPQGQRPGAGKIAEHTATTPDTALAAAIASVPDARPLTLLLPSQSPTPAWQVQMRDAGGSLLTVAVDDASGAVRAMTSLAGDSAAQWMRWIHEGSHAGPVWTMIVGLAGAFPPVLAVTGLVMWWRGRRVRRRAGRTLVPALEGVAAE